MTDCLRIISENTAHFAGGSYIRTRWADIAHPKPEETRTKDEIIDHMDKVISGLG